MKKILFLFSSIALFLALFASCKNVGVGEAIDLEAPKVAITYPSNNGFVPKSFDLMGVASDNRELTDIEVHYKYRETPEGERLTGIAHTNTENKKDGEWVCRLEFNFDQEVTIEVFARDKNLNESSDSYDSIVVVIDSQEPENGAMLITRNNGFTTSTAKIDRFLGEEGRTAKRNIDSANKDNFQNESFTLSCNVKETYEISKVYLELYEITNYESSSSYTKTKIAGDIPVNESTTNLYNPEFTIAHEDLVSYESSLASGLHYIMPEIYVIDGAGNTSLPLASPVPMVFAWEVEYDIPKALLPLYYENGLLKFAEGTTVPVVIFDDDGIKSYSYKLVSQSNPDAITTDKVKTGSENISSKNLRDHSFEINTEKFDDNATKIPDGNYTLCITVEDQLTSAMGGGIRENKTYNWEVPVKITNADAPTIDVSAPSYNSTPALTDKSKFTLTGKSIDNGPVSKIAIAWCRDDDSKTAIDYFEKEFDFDTEVSKDKKIESDDKKLVVWNIGRDNSNDNKEGTQYQDTFSKEFNIYTDFLDVNGNVVNKSKVIVIAAKDLTGNVSTEVWRVGAFNALPTFEITTSTDNATWKTETQSIVTKIPGTTLYVKILPKCTLELKSFILNGNSSDITNGGTVKIENPKDGVKQEITYSATDKIGNTNNGTFTIQFDSTPNISDIICNQDGAILRKDDTLEVQVIFDKTVTVTGKPQITVNCYTQENDEISAGTLTLDCTTEGESSSLIFRKAIPEGLEYKKNSVVKSDGTNWINLNGGTISRGEINARLTGEFDKTTNLTIDSKNPVITGYSGARAGANYSRDSSKNANIEIKFSEPVTVQNGNIEIWMKNSHKTEISGSHTWHIPAVISADVFEKIWNNSSDANRVVLSSSSTEKSVMGNDAYDEPTIVSAGPYKMYTNGLKVNDKAIYQYDVSGGNAVKTSTVIHGVGTVMVPDITTKYVLDWQFDTSDTSGSKKTISLASGTTNSVSVNDIRAALESVNYHKTTIPLSRLVLNSDRTVATLTLKDSDFIDGIRDGVEYIMEIPTNAVVDDVQNVRTQTEHNTFTFTVGNVAKPTIRVRRWTTNSTTKLDPYNLSTDENYTKAPVKIDCETPGATIQYQVTTLTIEQTIPDDAETDYQRDATPPDYMPAPVGAAAVAKNKIEPTFKNVGNLAGGTPSFGTQDYFKQIEAVQTYSTPFYVGEKSEVNSHRIYIASKASMTGTSDLLTSENSYEGAFKTVFYSKNPDAGTISSLKVFAVQTPEGVSYTAGWPITMRQHWNPTTGEAGTRDGYKLAYKDGTNYTLVSWELLSDDLFTMTTFGINFQRTINTLANYGSCIWGNEIYCWQ